MSTQQRQRQNVPARDEYSPGVLALFYSYLAWYVPRHFHGLLVAHADRFPAQAQPLIVCINHASWWDPLVILLLSRHLTPLRTARAPFEAKALAHYGFLRKVGAFPVDNDSSRAGTQFLRQAEEVMRNSSNVLWITPEGRFIDVRQRPIAWRPGAAALTRHLGACTVVPLAIEYTFWDERLPEVLCSVGEPLFFSREESESTADRNARLQAAMAATQDALAERAMKRNPALFETVFSGGAGVSAMYDLWRRMKAAVQGRPYVAEHRVIAPK